MKELVDRFLSWNLPLSVCSDSCVTELDHPNRYGTNLLTATEAEQMLRHVVGPLLEQNTKFCEALESIAAKHLEPFCPELFDDLAEVIRNDTQIARDALNSTHSSVDILGPNKVLSNEDFDRLVEDLNKENTVVSTTTGDKN